MHISEIINYLKEHLQETDITLNEGASDYEVFLFEQAYNTTLPDDFREFYKFSNGFHSEEDDFNIIPLEEIIDSKAYHKSKIYIAEYMVFCDMWELEINTNNVNEYAITVITSAGKITLTKSFAEFLEVFLYGGVYDTGGLYDWQGMLTGKK